MTKTVNYIKAKDSVVKFHATEAHKNVVSHLDETKYTCDLKNEKGRFLQTIIIDEEDEKVKMKVYWDINVNEEYKERLSECVEKINDFQRPLGFVAFDSFGRFFSSASERYEDHEISIATLECMQEICLEAYENFVSEVSSVNVGNSIDESAFERFDDIASYFYGLDDEEETTVKDDLECVENIESIVNYKTFRLISLRPAVYSGRTFFFSLEFDNSKLFRVDMNRCIALGLKSGDTVYLKAKAFFGLDKFEYIDVYMSGRVLDKFIDSLGTDEISGVIFADLEAVYKVYSSSGDPYCNDSELVAFKLVEFYKTGDDE